MDYRKENEDGTVTQTLRFKSKWGEKEVTEIKFRRPKGKDIKRMKAEPTPEDIIRIATNISDYTPAFFDELDAFDYSQTLLAVSSFLSDGQET